ncbi:MAG TPA: HEAT repeat domain-containing protein [Gaiellaceae bacterium]
MPERPEDGFKLNEPAPRIRGGATRKSVRVPRRELPQVAQRERLNAILLAHDPDVAEENRAKLKEADFAMLRQVAQEGALAGTPPALRQNAIALLAERPTPDNLDVLTHLARTGDDLYVRGAALAALGKTGLRLAAPILAEGLAARDPIEAASAEHGVVALGKALGEGGLRAAFHGEKRKAVLDRLERAIQRIEPRGERAAKPRATAGDA